MKEFGRNRQKNAWALTLELDGFILYLSNTCYWVSVLCMCLVAGSMVVHTCAYTWRPGKHRVSFSTSLPIPSKQGFPLNLKHVLESSWGLPVASAQSHGCSACRDCTREQEAWETKYGISLQEK